MGAARRFALLSALCWVRDAVAASPEAEPKPDEPSVVAPTPRPSTPDRAPLWVRWSKVGPDDANALIAVAVSPLGDDLQLLMAADGRVYASRDGGVSWRSAVPAVSALGDASGSEAAMLDLETRMNELVDDLGDFVTSDDIEDAGVMDELVADVRSGSTMFEQLGPAVADLRPHMGWAADGSAMVPRSDGLWIADPTLTRWTRVFHEPVVACAERSKLTLCAGPSGVWLSADRESFLRATSAPDLVVYDVLATEEAWWLATPDGLVSTDDGFSWTDASGPRPAIAVAQLSAGLTVSDGDTLWTRDGAGRWLRGPDLLLVGVRAMIATRQDGDVAAAVGGVFATDAHGVWRAVSDEAVAGVSLARDREGLLVVAGDGLLRGRAESSSRGGASGAWVSLDDLLLAAERRNGVDPRRGALGPAGQALVWLLPQVRVSWQQQRYDPRSSRIDQGLDLDRRLVSQFGIWATWSPPRSSLNATDATVDVDDDGTVSVYAGGGDNWMALGRVSRRASVERLAVASELTTLFQRRDELVRQLEATSPPLRDGVHLRLRVMEIEARMDVLTDGAVHRFNQTAASGGGKG